MGLRSKSGPSLARAKMRMPALHTARAYEPSSILWQLHGAAACQSMIASAPCAHAALRVIVLAGTQVPARRAGGADTPRCAPRTVHAGACEPVPLAAMSAARVRLTYTAACPSQSRSLLRHRCAVACAVRPSAQEHGQQRGRRRLDGDDQRGQQHSGGEHADRGELRQVSLWKRNEMPMT